MLTRRLRRRVTSWARRRWWPSTVAAWVEADRDVVDDETVAQAVIGDLQAKLEAAPEPLGWRLDRFLGRPPVTTVNVSVSDNAPGVFERGRLVVLAELRYRAVVRR